MKRVRPSPRLRRTPLRPVVQPDQIGALLWRHVRPYLRLPIQHGSGLLARGLAWLAVRPLQRQIAMVILVGLVLGWSVWSLISPAPLISSQVYQEAPLTPIEATTVPDTSVSDADAVLVTVAGYNQASIAAGQSIRADVLQPFLAEDGRTWPQVQTEFVRRVRRGETTDAELVRWGVVDSQI